MRFQKEGTQLNLHNRDHWRRREVSEETQSKSKITDGATENKFLGNEIEKETTFNLVFEGDNLNSDSVPLLAFWSAKAERKGK